MRCLITIVIAALSLNAFGQIPNYVPSDGLVAWYPFNGNANDESGNGNDGTVTGTTLDIDRFNVPNSCYSFDGDDQIEVSNVFYNNGWLEYTLSIWFKTSNANQTMQNLFNTIPHDGEGMGWNHENALSKISHWKNSNTALSQWDILSAHPLENNNVEENSWTHIVIAKQGLTYTYYINSVFDNEVTTSIAALQQFTGIRFGSIGGSEFLNGSLDDIGIWNRTLSEEEILSLYNALPPNPGCTDVTACNYDSMAEFNDGTCQFEDACGVCGGTSEEGCMDSDACNFNSEAECEGEACDYSCCPGPGCCTDGMYWDWDLQGCFITNSTDSNLDGCTDLNDLMDILSAYGDCAVPDFPPLTDDNIYQAVELWNEDEAQAVVVYGHISEWNVSSVTNMGYMFYDDTYFNQDISSWDVSSVTDMSHMFNYANSFNSDLSTWDVSSVTNMKQMFNAASSFNSDISSWNVSSVTNMFVMFYNVPNFNSDISSWNVSSVINMYGMFHNADNFNSDLSSWDVSSVTNMQQMFQYAGEFNSDISSWDVSSVTNMLQMFSSTNSFNSDLSSWDVSSVTSMNNMFLMASGLSAQNKCLIHTSFSSNANWPYDWSGYCPPSPCGDLVSHDGYDYSIVQIGDQCWFAENCRYLPSVSPSSEGNNTDPYYYVYDYEGVDVAAAKTTSNYESYGVLYNWPAVMAEGICPSGWHIPSDGEWQTMEMSLGMSESEAASEGWRGSPVGDYLKSTYGWNNNGNGNNSSGFNGLPGGYFYFGFDHYGGLGYWWSASEYASENGSFSWFRELYDGSDVVMRSGGSLSGGLSARCIKD